MKRTPDEKKDAFRDVHLRGLELLHDFCEAEDGSLIFNLVEAFLCIRLTPDWSADSVQPSFEEHVAALAPNFIAAPIAVRREALYSVLCVFGWHGEAWLYREGVRETHGPDATARWRPAWYDLEEQHFGRSVVSAAVVRATFPWTLQQLIDRGHSVHGVDSVGRTALHHAASLKFEKGEADYSHELLEVLIGAGAAIDARDATGQTALDLAIAGKRRNRIAALVLGGAVPTTANRLRSVRRIAEKFGWRNELFQQEAKWSRACLNASLPDSVPGQGTRMRL